MTRLALIILAGIILLYSPVSGQQASDAEVRGSNVPLHAAPDPESEVRIVLQRHTPVRVLGHAENATGETKLIAVDTFGLSTDWFIPVEVVETAETGWIPERYLTSRGVRTGAPVAPAIESPPSALAFSATAMSTSTVPSVAATVATVVGSVGLGLTPEEAAYVVDISSVVMRNSQSLARQADLLRTPRFGNASWEDELQAEVDLWGALQGETATLHPAASMSEFHRAYLSALSYQFVGGTAMMGAIRNLDAESIDRANALMQEGARLITPFIAIVIEYLSDRGIEVLP